MDSPNICDRCQQPVPDDAPFGLCACEALGDLLEDVQEAQKASEDEKRVGDYRILRKIGEGGFGEVFLATQNKPVHWRVALKVLKRGIDSAAVVRRFGAEQKALARMDHPNVASIFDGGATEDGLPFFVMEYVDGTDIKRFCQKHALNIEDRIKLFIQVCRGVHHAHQKGIIHRDIKPSNVMVSAEDGEFLPKVIDFGISKAVAPDLNMSSMVTRPNQLVGTLSYMSPEQAMRSADIDVTSDVYALGCLLYELLTGVVPIGRSQLKSLAPEQVLQVIAELEPPRPSARLERIGNRKPNALTRETKSGKRLRGDVDWIVMKAISKDRQRRYETADDFAKDLDAYLHNLPVTAQPDSQWYVFKKFALRHQATVIAAGAVAAAILVGAVATITMYARAESRRSELSGIQQERMHEEKSIQLANADVDRFVSLSLEQLYLSLQRTDDVKLLSPIAAKALDAYRTTEVGEDHETYIKLFRRLGDIFREDRNARQATDAYTRSAEIAKTAGSNIDQASALIALAKIEGDEEDFSQAMTLLHDAERVIENAPTNDDLAMQSFQAELYRTMSAFQEARGDAIPRILSSAQKAENVLVQVNSTNGIELSKARKHIARLKAEQSAYVEARAAAESALSVLPDSLDDLGKVECADLHEIIGMTHASEGAFPLAVAALTKSVELLGTISHHSDAWKKRHSVVESKLARYCSEIEDAHHRRLAEAFRASAIGRWENLLSDGPDNPELRKRLADEHFKMCRLLKGQGRYFEPYRRRGIEALNSPSALSDRESVRLKELLNEV